MEDGGVKGQLPRFELGSNCWEGWERMPAEISTGTLFH